MEGLPAARAPTPPSASPGTCWLVGPLGRGNHPIGSLTDLNRPRLPPRPANPRLAAAPLPPRARPSERCFRVGPGAEVMAPWALLSPGVLVRTGHTVLTWGITLVLFLHDTGEPGTPDPTWLPTCLGCRVPLLKPQRSWNLPGVRQPEAPPRLEFRAPPADSHMTPQLIPAPS